MKRLWWQLLDRFFPRYCVGVDMALVNTMVVMQVKRDGTFRLISVNQEGEQRDGIRAEGDA